MPHRDSTDVLGLYDSRLWLGFSNNYQSISGISHQKCLVKRLPPGVWPSSVRPEPHPCTHIGDAGLELLQGTRFNITMFYQYRNSHVDNRKILRPSSVHITQQGYPILMKRRPNIKLRPKYWTIAVVCQTPDRCKPEEITGILWRYPSHYNDIGIPILKIISILMLTRRYIYTETVHMAMSGSFVTLALVSILFLFHPRNNFTPMSTTRVLNHEHSCCARNHDIYFLELAVETAVGSISLTDASATSWPENTRMCIILCGYDNADLALPPYGCLN